jgi:hypothetical protein
MSFLLVIIKKYSTREVLDYIVNLQFCNLTSYFRNNLILQRRQIDLPSFI